MIKFFNIELNITNEKYIAIGKCSLYEIKKCGLPINPNGFVGEEKEGVAKEINISVEKLFDLIFLSVQASLDMVEVKKISEDDLVLLAKLFIIVCRNTKTLRTPFKFLEDKEKISEWTGIDEKELAEIYFLIFKATIETAILEKEKLKKKYVIVTGFVSFKTK